MEKTVIDGRAGLEARVGEELGPSGWRTLTFEEILRFADATGDHQWIHVDRERIARESPFGVPVAHGYYSLSLMAGRFFELVEIQGASLVVNYGCNRVRWPSPLPEGARHRFRCKLLALTPCAGGQDAVLEGTIEVEGAARPACVAELVYRFLWR